MLGNGVILIIIFASKLEWAKLVENMSGSSKVVILKAPRILEDWEQSSPKLLIQILLGILVGAIFALFVVIYKELADKKLSYSMLGDDVIYDVNKEFKKLKSILFVNKQENIGIITFEKIPSEISTKLQDFRNISIKQADLSEKFQKICLMLKNSFCLKKLIAQIPKTIN